MRYALFCLLLPVLALSACKKAGDESDEVGERSEMAEPSGSYDIDPSSGEVRATHTDEAGVTTTMRAGKAVPPVLPAPFATYPGGDVTSTTRVEQGEGAFVTLDFTTADTRAKVVEFYRRQAVEAGIEPEIDISSDTSTTLGGEAMDGKISFTLSATRKDDRTDVQLSVASGFD